MLTLLIFQSDCTVLYSCQQCMRVVVTPHPHQHLELSIFLILAFLGGVYWYFIMVLICIFQITNVELLFTCSLVTQMSLYKVLFQVFCPHFMFLLRPHPISKICISTYCSLTNYSKTQTAKHNKSASSHRTSEGQDPESRLVGFQLKVSGCRVVVAATLHWDQRLHF